MSDDQSMPLLHQLRLLRADMRVSVSVREYIRANALESLEPKGNAPEQLLVLRLIDRLDKRYPIGSHAWVGVDKLSASIKTARDEQPITGLKEPWITRLERFGPVYAKHYRGQVERKMTVRRVRQLVQTWTAYRDFIERIRIEQATERDQKRVERAKSMNAMHRLPARLRRTAVTEDLMI